MPKMGFMERDKTGVGAKDILGDIGGRRFVQRPEAGLTKSGKRKIKSVKT
jgi:hypothetical protein